MENIRQQSLFETQEIHINKKIRLIELFGGYGSQAMAFENIGADFETYRLVEFDKYAVMSYNAAHGTNFEPMDITQTSGADLGIVDTDKYCYVMTYSFPCQDLSVAGKQKGMEKGSGTRSGLLWEVERLLNEAENLPQVLVMENVTQVHSTKNLENFYLWIDFLRSKGYTGFYQDLNAKNYGVAQNRNRCFMVSILGNYDYNFPKEIKLEKTIKNYLEESVDEKYYLNENSFLSSGYCGNAVDKSKKDHYDRSRALLNPNIAYTVSTQNDRRVGDCNFIVEGLSQIALGDFIKKTNDNKTKIEAGRIVGRNPVNPKSRIAGEKTVQMLEINQNPNVSNTLTTVTKDNILKNGYRIRKLTPRECGRLMGVKDETITKMQNVNSNSQLYKQFGNSIVVPVLEAIFRNMNIKGIKTWEEIQTDFSTENPDPICLNSKGGRNGIAGLQPSVQDRIYSSEGTSTAITTAFRPSILENGQPKRLFNIYGENKGTGFAGNVWDKEAIAPTLTTMQGGGRQPMILDDK